MQEHKSDNKLISETRKDRRNVTMEGALSNGTVPDSLRPPLPHDWVFANPPQNFNRYYLGIGKSYGLWICPVLSQGPS